MKNFEHSGKILIWSKLIIFSHSVAVKFVDEEPPTIRVNKFQKWKASPFCEWQYLFQIVTNDENCFHHSTHRI